MKNSRLYVVLQALSPPKHNAFSKFLASPYFNTREDVIQLYQYLYQHINENQDLAKEEAFSYTYPEEVQYDDTRMRLCMSYLNKLLEKFLTIEHALQEKTETAWHLHQALWKLELNELADKSLDRFIHDHEKENLRNADFWNWKYQLNFEKIYRSDAQAQLSSLPLQSIVDTLDISFISKKLRQVCLLLNRKAVYQTDFEPGLMEGVLHLIDEKKWLQYPAISVYYFAFLSLSERQDENHFIKFKKELFEFGNQFPPAELHQLHLLAINYCVQKINEGNLDYFQEVLDLYKEGLEKETLIHNGILSRFTYYNIVVAALKTGDFNWAEWFIPTYKNRLEKKYRDSAFSFNLARLHYSKGNKDDALSLLQKANYRDLLLNLAAKTLAMKIYYETKAHELLQSHLEAMKKYISRKHVTGNRKDNYLNIIKMTQGLINLNFYDKKAIENFRQKINQTEPLTEKEWLLEQLETLH
jgi:hypothetical protein